MFVEGSQNESLDGLGLNSKGSETVTSVKEKIYEHQIHKYMSGLFPLFFGTRPKPCKGHSVLLLGDDRILIIKKGSTPDDCTWFLEVDTNYVRKHTKIIGTEVVAWSKGARGEAKTPVVISGPSGVGKGTLISMIMQEFPSMFGFSVSHTTLAPRGTEKDGVHYHFTERGAMEKEIKDEKFIEYASVHGNLYGTSIEAVETVADSGKRCILDIDVQGARSVRASSIKADFIFICPPSMEELENRLCTRGTETEEQILKQLRNAKEELDQGKSSGIFDHVLCNDNLEECYDNIKKILGLDGTAVDARKPCSREESKSLVVLDMSSLRGGAPGWTRGLDIYSTDSFSDGFNAKFDG